jgi:hypothetical protein
MAQAAPPLPSPKPLSWHLVHGPDDLDAEAAVVVARVLQDDEAAKVIGLGRRFGRVVLSRCSAAPAKSGITTVFDAWLSDARACGMRWSRASPSASFRMGSLFVPAFALP